MGFRIKLARLNAVTGWDLEGFTNITLHLYGSQWVAQGSDSGSVCTLGNLTDADADALLSDDISPACVDNDEILGA